MQKRHCYPEMKKFSGNSGSSSQLELLITCQRKSRAENTLVTQRQPAVCKTVRIPCGRNPRMCLRPPEDASPLPLMCCCHPAQVQRTEKRVLITCTDTGASVAPDALGHCFQRRGPAAAAPDQRRLQTLVALSGRDASPAARPPAEAKGTAPPSGQGRAVAPQLAALSSGQPPCLLQARPSRPIGGGRACDR